MVVDCYRYYNWMRKLARLPWTRTLPNIPFGIRRTIEAGVFAVVKRPDEREK